MREKTTSASQQNIFTRVRLQRRTTAFKRYIYDGIRSVPPAQAYRRQASAPHLPPSRFEGSSGGPRAGSRPSGKHTVRPNTTRSWQPYSSPSRPPHHGPNAASLRYGSAQKPRRFLREKEGKSERNHEKLPLALASPPPPPAGLSATSPSPLRDHLISPSHQPREKQAQIQKRDPHHPRTRRARLPIRLGPRVGNVRPLVGRRRPPARTRGRSRWAVPTASITAAAHLAVQFVTHTRRQKHLHNSRKLSCFCFFFFFRIREEDVHLAAPRGPDGGAARAAAAAAVGGAGGGLPRRRRSADGRAQVRRLSLRVNAVDLFVLTVLW